MISQAVQELSRWHTHTTTHPQTDASENDTTVATLSPPSW